MTASPSFNFEPRGLRVTQRFDEFIDWAQPGGTGGFNRFHVERYVPDDPFFSLSKRLVPHSHGSARVWFVKQEKESIKAPGRFYTRAAGEAVPEVLEPDALIKPGRFLRFAKAYLNLFSTMQDLRSTPKPTVRALIYLEKALRELNGEDNDPAGLSHLVFQRAALMLHRSKQVPGVKYDAGKALEQIALVAQGGGTIRGSKLRRRVLPGFNLIKTPFVFRSPIKSPPRHGKRAPSERELRTSAAAHERNLTGEQVAAVGMAYRRAIHRFGRNSAPAFYAAITAVPLTTASMRASELQTLRLDALYFDGDRPRLRIPRPKLNLEQDVPVPRKLGPLAQELFGVIAEHSAEARAAISSYIKQSPKSHKGVRTLYIPDRLKPYFSKQYMTHADVWAVMNPGISVSRFPVQMKSLERTYFVDAPGDLYSKPSKFPMVRIRDFVDLCRTLPVTLALPEGTQLHQFVSRRDAEQFCSTGLRTAVSTAAIGDLFRSTMAVKPTIYLSRDDVMSFLLADFKRLQFPHWPFATKDKSVRLDSALALHHRPNSDVHVAAGAQQLCWWLPCLLSIKALNFWIGRNSAHPPLLFELTDVRLDDGGYPTLSVHKTRRFHHTSALAAGANPHLLNQLAGRQSGWQADAYDMRSPRQILKCSIETFDPDDDIEAIGPVADQAPPPRRVVDRKVFLMQNAAPKHVHETGGCSSDLSLDPCYQFGDCMRCGSHVWRKGDIDRLPRILSMKAEATRIIKVGAAKLKRNPRLVSIANHVRQAKEVQDRCDEILRVEADPCVTVGTIVTFNAAPSAMSDAQLFSWLRKLGKAESPRKST